MGPGSPLAPYLDRWNQLPRSRQLALGAIAAAAVVLFYVVFISSSKPNMVVAYSGLAPEDSAAIADQLESDGIPYEVGAGGSSVSVPANKVAEVRIALARQNLPAGGAVGLELFDKTNFGATDFNNRVNYQRALQGELTRSINTLTVVRASRVHLVMPEDSLFVEDQKKATASVILQLERGTRLTQDEIQGITNLVSYAVEGLDQGGVTIMDDTGRVLFDGATFDSPFSTGATTSQMDVQHQYELALQRDVEGQLATVVGPGRSAVTVRAQLNFDSITESADTFDSPENAVPRSSTTTSETFTGSGLTVGNVPGTGANGETAIGADGSATGNSQYERTETTTNNEISRTTTSTVRAPGSLERLSVSVVLDESVSAQQETAIRTAVAAAVGLDQTRGDILSVTRIPFDASVRDAFVVPAGDGLAQYLDYLKLVLPILAVSLAFILVMLLLRSLSNRQFAVPSPAYRQPALAEGPVFPSIAPGVPVPALEPTSNPHEERVYNLASSNPRAVAQVVQTWMREEA
jgi:flagellar M-ring protein FliF